MPDASPADLNLVRNIGVIAHIDAGKTTTTEHLLYYSGAKHKLGGVDQGTTETDFDQEEQQRGITIYSACIPLEWNGHTINLIDTPGHVDFTAEVERSLRVLDGAVCVFDAQKGVEAQSETVWRQANKYHVPRLVFINKMDVVGANFDAAIEGVRERLEANPVPIVVPMGAGSRESLQAFCGVIDVIEQKAVFYDAETFGKSFRAEPIPAEFAEMAKAYRERLFNVLAENDPNDRVTSAFLEGREIEPLTVRELIREQTLNRLIQPVLAGSGREHIGVQLILDAVTQYLPSPLDRPPVVGVNPRKPEKTETRKPDKSEPFAGLVFKVISDVNGEVFYVRIYSGVMKANSRVYNPGKDGKETVAKIFHVYADPKQREDMPEAHAGDIVACMGLKEAVTGDTLCDSQQPILLEQITFVEPVVSQSIEPESSADKQKLLDVLTRLRREDPTFVFKFDSDTGQTLMSGMGALHLEVKTHRMERDYKVKVRVGKPKVSYRETMGKAVKVTGECDRMLGAQQMFAKLAVEFKPGGADPACKAVNKLKPGVLPPNFMAAAERGLKGALGSGEFGFPLLYVTGTIIAAEMDAQLSTEVAFEVAASDAVNRALKNNSVLLEPIMLVSVTVPEEYVGNVIGDLQSRRAEIDLLEGGSRIQNIKARVPLARMFDYEDAVRSLSKGRAASSMEPHAYAPAPDDVVRAFTGD